MTAQGHPYTRFRRALVAGSPMLAWTAAAELQHLDFEDAFSLCLLLSDRDPKRYPRAAARLLGRYCTESKGIDLDEALLGATLLAALPARIAIRRPSTSLRSGSGADGERWARRSGAGRSSGSGAARSGRRSPA